MSERIISLVHGLANQPRPYPTSDRNPTAARDRLMLLTLAVLADDTGHVEVSMPTLGRLTLLTPSPTRAALRSLADQGLLDEQHDDPPKPKTYRLNVDALLAQQTDVVDRERCSLYDLADYGLDRRTIERLEASPWFDTGRDRHLSFLDEGEEGEQGDEWEDLGAPPTGQKIDIRLLGTLIERYRALPEQEIPRRGFAQYLQVRMIGVTAADRIMAAYDAWAADQ